MATSKQLLNSLEKAQEKFSEALSFENTEPLRESLIQRFEYTFELCWKLMGSVLRVQGIETAGVRNIIRAAAQIGLIDNPQAWLEFADARNLTSHLYREDIALQVYRVAKTSFLDAVKDLMSKASKLAD